MTVWMVATVGFAVLVGACGLLCFRGSLVQRLIGLQLAGALTALAFVTFAVAAGRPLYLDVGVVVALTSFIAGLVYARFAERWL